jgi:type II secretory pathway component GspD/PulD (secretin)
MNNHLRTPLFGAIALLALIASPCAGAQSEPSATSRQGAVPIAQLLAAAAKRTGKTFIVDPRVQGEALLIGLDPAKLDYAQLLSVLQVHGFAVVEHDKVVRVFPEANVRQQPVPYVTGKESHPDAEYVTKTITVKNVPAAQLVPILRPLLPQQGHLVAFPCTNQLMIVDTFGNVQRIEKLVQTLDIGGPYTPPSCDGPEKPSG